MQGKGGKPCMYLDNEMYIIYSRMPYHYNYYYNYNWYVLL